MTALSRSRRAAAATVALVTVTLVPGLLQLPAVADEPAPAQARQAPLSGPDLAKVRTLGDAVAGKDDLDARGRALPSAVQRRAVARLGVADVRWNRFGTPSSLLPADGVLATAASSDPVQAARSWLSSNAAVFGLTPAKVSALEVVGEQRLAQSGARAVLFRQKFGNLTPALASMVTVGVSGRTIAYASSSLSRTTGTPPAPTLSPLQGWLKAAADVGRAVPGGDVGAIVESVSGGWTRLKVPGFDQEQLVRLRALAMADGSVRPVLESNVVDAAGIPALGYTLMIDAVTGKVLHRENKVENSSDFFPFTGAITATTCGPKHPFQLTDNATRSVVAVASTVNAVNDIEVRIFGPGDVLLATGDLGTSPETATYAAPLIAAGTYSVQVCPFAAPTVPFVAPGNYAVAVTTSDQGAPGAADLTANPRWRFFPSNPELNFSAGHTPRSSVVGCWNAGSGCTLRTGALANVQALGPWDFLTASGTSSLSTVGNNANTHEAWASPLTPGGTEQAPVSATQDYTQAFTDRWNNSRCNPAELTPGGNDINASVTNLFVAHNRMHDYSYYLGFDERNYNLQLDNAGRGGAESDPEIGNAQAGALTGGQPSYLGRDNANQIALQDGVPGITNQYLFQPIAGSFYAPCTDGGLDMGIVGHEYTHAISNRMVGGPDEGLTSEQGGAMGESWGDLVAAEYQFSHGYSNGGNIWAVGVYATGNKQTAIRDYAINRNPLNYSDYGFDTTGVEVHADGEIWNGTMWEVRQALVKKWNKRYPVTNRSLQLRCAQGTRTASPLPAQACPGNRRWVQLMFDSFLLQQGATSMLDARDAMIAADRMRFGGANSKVLWDAFARRGMGRKASTPNADSGDPKPSFASPKSRNGKVTLRSKSPGRFYVGDYEARVAPVADTVRKTGLRNVVTMAPGRYRMLFVSARRGFTRFVLRVRPGRTTYRVKDRVNLAARAAGAKVIRSTAGSLNPGSLIDGTELTNWGGVTEGNVDATRPSVTVDLAGRRVQTLRRVAVSAYLNPSPPDGSELPLAADPDSGSRFTALRRFALEACVRRCGTTKARWKRFYTSKPNAFPSQRPRPVAPTLNLRSFKVRPTRAAAVRLVVLENQCTGYAGYAGEQDADPLNATDCKAGSDRGTIVHAAELQVFGRR
ncbi:M36 family metallopeptidase [Nocardioides sp. 503]|uniref:M36 family metallopeptidase n=1 Tax=Nocardioides sp. 503 TaxID=2508326 RepID=UPI00106FE415|nr:M36 family metallopeptidase [Nocardioides sp. 503]